MPKSLPPEILAYVIAQITDMRDLQTLCKVSKFFYRFATQRKYEVHGLTLRFGDDPGPGDTDGEAVLKAARSQRGLLDRVTKLHVTSTFLTKPWRSIRLIGRLRDINSKFERSCDRFQQIARELPAGKLREFTWSVGVRVPRQLLGRDGYIPIHQKNLEHLAWSPTAALWAAVRVRTWHWGSWIACKPSLGWGYERKEKSQPSVPPVRKNAKHLRGLTLDFIRWDLVMKHWNMVGDRADYISRHGLRIDPTSPSLQYPALSALSLSGLDITPYARGLACATRSPSLRSITIRRCPGWDEFLRFFVEPGSELTLHELEIYQPVHFHDPADADVVVREFLNSARGLQNIYVSGAGPCNTRLFWRAIAARHSSTLRRLVYHVRQYNPRDESRRFQRGMDMNDLGLVSESFWNRLLRGNTEFDGDESADSGSDELRLDDDSLFNERSPNPLEDLQLECIGLACRPFRLREVLEPFTKKDCLRMEHIRQSGSDIRCFGSWVFRRRSPPRFPVVDTPPPTESRRDVLFLGDKEPGWVSTVGGWTGPVAAETVLNGEFCHFADWAFGKDGIASLEMVAYGDFSCQGRFGQDCFMLRRGGTVGGQPYPYSFYFPESQEHPDLEKLLSRSLGFLEACPTETLPVSRR